MYALNKSLYDVNINTYIVNSLGNHQLFKMCQKCLVEGGVVYIKRIHQYNYIPIRYLKFKIMEKYTNNINSQCFLFC